MNELKRGPSGHYTLNQWAWLTVMPPTAGKADGWFRAGYLGDLRGMQFDGYSDGGVAAGAAANYVRKLSQDLVQTIFRGLAAKECFSIAIGNSAIVFTHRPGGDNGPDWFVYLAGHKEETCRGGYRAKANIADAALEIAFEYHQSSISATGSAKPVAAMVAPPEPEHVTALLPVVYSTITPNAVRLYNAANLAKGTSYQDVLLGAIIDVCSEEQLVLIADKLRKQMMERLDALDK